MCGLYALTGGGRKVGGGCSREIGGLEAVCVFGSGRRSDWQSHRKDRTLARFARHGYIAAHHARELARDGKAQPRAAKVLRGRGIGLTELLEQLSLLLRSHANACVSNRELDPVATVGDPARPQPDLA